MNILFTAAFDGSRYSGTQFQQNAPSVNGALQSGVEKLTGTRHDLTGCCRLDSGVHALGYRFQCRFAPGMPLDKLPLGLNAHLPADIRVLKAQAVAESLHARYSPLSKKYRYVFRPSYTDSPFATPYSWRVAPPLDITAMQRAADFLPGSHDFTSFMTAGPILESHTRTVLSAAVEAHAGTFGQEVWFTIEANGFLYNMVRILAGTLWEVGAGKRPPEDIKTVLSAKNRVYAGPTAPAKGLFLVAVRYPENLLGEMKIEQ